jgi:hypothetical protein
MEDTIKHSLRSTAAITVRRSEEGEGKVVWVGNVHDYKER